MSPRRSSTGAAVAALLPLGACVGTGHADLLVYGSMRQVMRDGEVEPRVRLAELELSPLTYAVGALADLAGEITIADGTVYLATATDGTFRAATVAPDTAATLLVVTAPDDMRAEVCADALDEPTLAALLRRTHAETIATVDIRGTARSLALHVARGACPHNAVTPATEPWRWRAPAGTTVRLVGVYAPNRAGTMTHHGTSFHLHAIVATPDGDISGHVDAFELAPGATVTAGGPGL